MQFNVKVIDVDVDPNLEERYGDLVPLLMERKEEIFHYHLVEKRLRSYLNSS